MNGFFAPYAYLGMIILVVIIIFVFILAWIAVKAFKNKWAFPITIIITSLIFYFLDVKFLASIFAILSMVTLVVMMISHIFIKKQNIKQKK